MEIFVGLLLSLLLPLVPALFFIGLLWWLDRYEREPLWLLAVAFLWGAVPTIIMSLIAQLLLAIPVDALLGNSLAATLTGGSIIAPLSEEGFKALLLVALFFFYRREFDGPLDGILYGALVGFGFSVVEDALYLVGAFAEGGWAAWGGLAALRVGLFTLNHSLFTAMTGLGFGLARLCRRWWPKPLLILAGLLLAIILHALHNAGAALGELTSGLSLLGIIAVDWGGALVLFVVIMLFAQLEKGWLRELAEEVSGGTISAEDYRVAGSYRARFAENWRVLFRRGPGAWWRVRRRLALLTELAYKKHQRALTGEAGYDRLIADLRARLQQPR